MDSYSLLKVRTEIFPSEEAHARIAPSSWGAQETEFTGGNALGPANRASTLLTRSGVEGVFLDLGPTTG